METLMDVQKGTSLVVTQQMWSQRHLVVQENLRQLCVFQLANQSGQSYRWWEYVTKFGQECTMAGNQYNEACAERVTFMHFDITHLCQSWCSSFY